MYIKIPATVLLFLLINLASSYRLESQSGDLDINSTSVLLTEEIAGLTDNYEPWREWPDRLFPRFHTSSDYTKPSWTVITKSKTALSSDSYYSSDAFPQTPNPSSVYSSSSGYSSLSTLSPTVSDYFGESSSIYLPPINSNILSSHTIESSFNTNDLHTSLNQDPYLTLTPSVDSSSFQISTPTLPQSTPSMPLSSSILSSDASSEFSSNTNQFSSISSIDRTAYETISSTSSELASSIQPSPTINLPDSTAQLNETTSHNSNIPKSTTPLPSDNNLQYRHKTVIIFKQLPEGMKNTTIEFEDRLKKVFELAYSRLHGRNATSSDVNIDNLDWSSYDVNKTLIIIYSVKLDGKYLNDETIQKLLATLSDDDIRSILNATKIISRAEPFTQNQTEQPPTNQPTKPDFKLSELLNGELFNLNGPYFWIMICLFLLITLICCFYFSMLVCWIKNRNKKKYDSSFIKDRKNQLSPVSNYSSDTLNTENFIRWRSRPTSVKEPSKREKSLFKDDLKTSSLSKLKRKEIGSSPSNEFEYISFSSDTTNSSLQRDGSLNKRAVRHHPYSQDYNKNISKNPNYSKQDLNRSDFVDYQQDYQQDYHIPTIQKINQLNQPNGIKLLISRGVQNNLLTDSNFQSDNKKFPLEIPSPNSYYGNTVSVLNLSKEKLIPLNQYHTSDSSTTTTTSNTISDRNDSNSSKQKLINDQRSDRFGSRLSGSNSRPNSRISEPKRLIKKEIIEEFETTTTTTTFKNNNNRPNNSDNLNKDAQLNEQTQTIIKAIKDELNKFHYNPK